MTTDEKITYIRSRLTDAELLAGLAEEAAELSAAALKLRRAMEEINPTPMDGSRAELELTEELGDVINYLQALGLIYAHGSAVYLSENTDDFRFQKLDRWVERLGGEIHD